MRGWVSLGFVIGFSVTQAMADDGAFQWQAVGAQTYATVCGACHQPSGQGVPGAFPALAGHAPTILTRLGGRDYLIKLVLYGVAGSITVNGKPFNGVMPPWGQTLNDEQLAGALNYVLHHWDNDKALPSGFQPIAPAEIAAARGSVMTAEQVYALRGADAPSVQAASVPLSFTQEQADRGQAIYRRTCQDCHGANLNDGEFGGAPLTGQYFARHWGNGSVAALYGYMHAKMPPDRPGKLNPQTYADLTAYLLIRNGYEPTQSELPPDPDIQQHMEMKR